MNSVETKTRNYHDVVVVGGGIAGVCAAVSAARVGKSVLLLEKGVNLGGLATVGLISWYEPLCDGQGEQLISGIAEELIRLSASCGFDNLPAHWGGKGQNAPRNERFSTFYSPTFFSMALDQFVLDSGAELLFDTLATYPVMKGKHCKGVIVENANGREFYPAGVVIDATGDASVLHRAGVPTQTGENYLTYIVHEMDDAAIKDYASHEDLSKLRRWKNCGSDYAGNGHPDGLKRFCGNSAEEITEYMVLGKQLMMKKYEGTDKDHREIMTLPTMPQFRTVRHLSGEGAFSTSAKQTEVPNSIGTVGDFRYVGKRYAIPYSALCHSEYDNLLAAGRIINVSDADSWEVARVIPVCALTGEIAGKAAALCVAKGRAVYDLTPSDVEQLWAH